MEVTLSETEVVSLHEVSTLEALGGGGGGSEALALESAEGLVVANLSHGRSLHKSSGGSLQLDKSGGTLNKSGRALHESW